MCQFSLQCSCPEFEQVGLTTYRHEGFKVSFFFLRTFICRTEAQYSYEMFFKSVLL